MSSTPPHQAIYRRWRAQTFGQIVGQQAVVETLRNAVRSGRTAQAYLFVGPRGTGKTSMARILAKALNCPNVEDGEPCDRCEACAAIRDGRALDVSEMDAASNNRVDDIRELLPRIYTAPSDLRRKVFIIDEVQRIREGWDVLLKTLEEPPEHVIFVFCTTDSSQIRPAVLSRVQRFDFRKLTPAEIAGKLDTILAADGRRAEPEAVELIARLAAGGMRDAESMLDQLLSSDGVDLTAARVRDVLGLAEAETVDAFAAALVSGDAVPGIELLDGLEERGRDLRSFTDQVVDTLRLALVASLRGRAAGGLGASDPTAIAAAIRSLADIDVTRLGPGGLRLQLELALLGSTARPETTDATPRPRPEADGAAPARRAAASVPTPRPDAPAMARPAREQVPPAPSAEATSGPAAPPRPATAAPAVSSAAKPPPAVAPREPAPSTRAAPASPAPANAAAPALQTLLERWPEIVAVISKHPPTKPLIEACRPISVDGAVVTLGFPEAQSFFKDVADRRKAILEEGVGRVLGAPVSVKCVATNLEMVPLPDDPDAARLLSEFRRIYGDDVVDVGEVR